MTNPTYPKTGPVFLVKSYTRYSASQTIALARQVKYKLTDHPVIKEPYPTYVPSLTRIGEGADALESAGHEALSRDMDKVARKNQCCFALQTDLGTLAHHCEMVAQGDPVVLLSAGFPAQQARGSKVNSTLPGAPQLTVAPGKALYAIACTVTRKQRETVYIEICEGDPAVEENWRKAGDGAYSVSKFEITGNKSATRYFLRARCVNTAGAGPWSTYVTIVTQ